MLLLLLRRVASCRRLNMVESNQGVPDRTPLGVIPDQKCNSVRYRGLSAITGDVAAADAFYVVRNVDTMYM